jgi:hypothetical protein
MPDTESLSLSESPIFSNPYEQAVEREPTFEGRQHRVAFGNLKAVDGAQEASSDVMLTSEHVVSELGYI